MSPSSSFPLISAMVTVAASSLRIVTVAPSAITTPKLVADKLPCVMMIVSSASTLVSTVGVIVKVCVSPAVPVKVKV